MGDPELGCVTFTTDEIPQVMGKRREEKARNLVRRGNRRRLRHLLNKHADLRSNNTAGLIDSAMWLNRGMLHWLLEHGVSPDGRTSAMGTTPLMSAAAHGDIQVMKLLLQFGADPNALNESSENALGYACSWQQPEAIRILAEAGVDVNDTTDSGPERTQLDWAGSSGHTEVVAMLRSLGGKRYVELNSGLSY
jgi:hypothetical protein